MSAALLPYNVEVSAVTGFTGNAYNPRTRKYTRRFMKYLRDNEGTYTRRFTFQDAPYATTGTIPLRAGDVYNPASGRIASASTVYTRRPGPIGGGRTGRVLRANIRRRMVDRFADKLAAFYAAGPDATLSLNLHNFNDDDLADLILRFRLDVPTLMTIYKPSQLAVRYVVSEKNGQKLADEIRGYLLENEEAGGPPPVSSSDAEVAEAFAVEGGRLVTLQKVKVKQNTGAFFPYTLNHAVAGTDALGVYTAQQLKRFNDKKPLPNCFVHALQVSGVDVSKCSGAAQHIAHIRQCGFVPVSQLVTTPTKTGLAERLGLNIHIHGDASRKMVHKCGKPEDPRVDLGLYARHFFAKRPVSVTSYALRHHAELVKKDPERWNEYVTATQRKKTRFLDSVQFVKLITSEELRGYWLEPIRADTAAKAAPTFSQGLELPPPNEMEVRVEYPYDRDEADDKDDDAKPARDDPMPTVWFDFETDTSRRFPDGSAAPHVPYLGCYTNENGVTFTFTGQHAGKKLLNHLADRYQKTGVRMIAHNMNYDLRAALMPYLSIRSCIERMGSVITADAYFFKMRIRLTDSYAFITEPLAKFGKMFNLETEKEVMPYGVYSSDNIARRWVPLAECLEHLSASSRKQYRENVERWGLLDAAGRVDVVEYSARYCRIDCEVLRDGWCSFRKMMKKLTGLDVHRYVTLASIADAYLIESGCYNGVCQLTGGPRMYIQKTLVGGRTMLANNRQCDVGSSSETVDDFDAVSLYPSAMARLPGFLLGAPKPITNDNERRLAFLSAMSGYYVRARVLSVAKPLQLPTMSYIDPDTGVRCFSNKMAGRVLYLDNVALEDAMRFQGARFEVLDGFYFDEGHNPKICDVIRHLFDARRKAKAAGNPIQNVIKLIMNSCYGKTALKAIEDEVEYFKRDDMVKYAGNKYDKIKSISDTVNPYYAKAKLVKSTATFGNRVHCGVQILSMSKRIMYEVTSIPDELGLPLFYTDTDSIHLPSSAVPKVAERFRQMYGRELIGKDLGQFHTDFELKGCRDVVSERFIGLGKKCYVDKLRGVDCETGETRHGYHVRMKGVPSGAIHWRAQELGVSVEKLYERLLAGKAQTFDLLRKADGSAGCSFVKQADMGISSRLSFLRRVAFA